ncbi:MAG: T9SS type A sorting domain-containing protein, partial [Bacteroidota bacterium]
AVDGGPYTHGFCAPLALLGGYYFFEEHYEVPFTLDFSLEVVDATNTTFMDGSITIESDEDLSNYSVVWSNGEEGLFIDGLGGGEYTVVITNQEGCTVSSTALVDVLSSVENNNSIAPIIINPVENQVKLIWDQEADMELYSTSGQLLLSTHLLPGENRIDITGISGGLYLVTIHTATASFQERVYVRN